MITALLVAIPLFTQSSCDTGKPGPDKPSDATSSIELQLVPSSAVNMTAERATPYDYYTIETTAADPHVNTASITSKRSDDMVVLAFEYKSASPLDFIQIFFAEPLSEERSFVTGRVDASPAGWSEYAVILKDQLAEISWGNAGDYLRLDFGNNAGYRAEVRKFTLRTMTAQDEERYEREKNRVAELKELENRLGDYLSASYSSALTRVAAGETAITVSGNISGSGDFYLCEVAPYEDVVGIERFANRTPVDSPAFTIELDRYVDRDGFRYDRTLSRWVVVRQNGNADEIVSAARYADEITSLYNSSPLDAHRYHNWADAEDEFGLRIGLRRFPGQNFTEKPAWDVYKAAGTADEDKVFDPYLEVIGVEGWQEIMHPLQ